MDSHRTAESKSVYDPLAAAAGLVPLVLASRDEAERIRHLPPQLAEAFARDGLLQMFLPRGLGGEEVPPLVAFQAIETISKADGAAGWCAMIASILTAFAGWLPRDVGRALCGTPADLRMAGSIRPQGKAYPVDGGYRIEGQWDFASGIHYARWVTCPCVVMDGAKPALTAAGIPKTRIMWVPAAQMRIVDTWDTIGLRGTGSHDFAVENVFVPASHTSSLAEPAHHGR